jgi:hypothetical protein
MSPSFRLKDMTLGVVWHGTTTGEAELVFSQNIRPRSLENPAMITHSDITFDIGGKDVWVLIGERLHTYHAKVHLTRYVDGTARAYEVTGNLGKVTEPPPDIPRLVWERAVIETHDLTCGYPSGGDCRARHAALEKSGILL